MGRGAAGGLPVHLLQARVNQIAAVEACPDQGGDAPLGPGAFPGGGGGVHHRLHVSDRDVLARQAADHRGQVPGAEPPLGIGVLT